MKIGDLSDVEAWRPGGAPPPGTYTCRIDDAKEGESRNGFPQVEVSWTVADGDFKDAEIREWIVFTEKTKGRIKAFVDATGVPTPDGEMKVDDLIGRRAEVVVRAEPKWDEPEKTINKVMGYRQAPEQPASAPSGNGTAATPDSDLPF